MKTILGTGQLGIAVMEALLKVKPEEPITLVNRTGKLPMALPAHVKLIAADVTDNNDMEKIAQQSTVIFSCTDVPYQLWKTFYPATANALAHAMRNSETKLVVADNMYSYGNVKGENMQEEMPHAASTQKGIIRTSVINTLLLSGERFCERVAFVKAADFIGPGIHKGIFGIDFLDRLYEGKRILLSGNIALPHTFTYIHDFAAAIVTIGNAPDTFGQLWHVPNAPAMSLDKWIHLFEVVTNKKAKVTVVPKLLLLLAGLFDTLLHELYELAYQFEYPYLVDHSKYENRFGNHSTYPSDIVKETVQSYLLKKQVK